MFGYFKTRVKKASITFQKYGKTWEKKKIQELDYPGYISFRVLGVAFDTS